MVDGVAAGDDRGSSRIPPRVQIAACSAFASTWLGSDPKSGGGGLAVLPHPDGGHDDCSPSSRRERPSRWGSPEVASPACPSCIFFFQVSNDSKKIKFSLTGVIGGSLVFCIWINGELLNSLWFLVNI